MAEQWRQGEYTISTDAQRLDIDVIHSFLSQRSYWAEGIPREIVERGIKHSLNFGLYHGEKQVGFARVITDYATHAYLCDVFVVEEERGRGLSKWLMQVMLQHPALQGLRRWFLLTKDAQGLYEQVGFTYREGIETSYMEIRDADVYKRSVLLPAGGEFRLPLPLGGAGGGCVPSESPSPNLPHRGRSLSE
jgi:N-acetylglutamate synthase-like GNAT family acetyltransferase